MEESTPAAEAPVVETPVVETPAEPEVKTETIGQVLEPKADKESRTVPEAAFLEIKNANKEMKKELRELQRKIEDGATREEVSGDIEAIGEEFGVDKKFLNKLASAIRKDAEKDAEEKLSSRLKPIAEKERADKIDKVFATHFDKALAEMPEFADVVNRDVIKTLSLDPANQNKTFAQLIEDTYGKAIPGKRTLETTTPRGGKTTDKVDLNRASQDQTYLKEVLANPDTRKEYNESLTDRLSASL